MRAVTISITVTGDVTVYVGQDVSAPLDQILASLDIVITNQGATMAAIDTILTEVTETRGAADSIIALVGNLAQFIRDNIGNEEALLAGAAQLDGIQTDILAAVNANPLPGQEPVPTPEPPAEPV